MYLKHFAQLTLAFAAFLGKDVTQMRLTTFVTARRIWFKALRSATIALHFWHFKLQFNVLSSITLDAGDAPSGRLLEFL